VQSYICRGEFSQFIWSVSQNLRGVLILVSLSLVVNIQVYLIVRLV